MVQLEQNLCISQDPTEKVWFRDRIEKEENQLNFTNNGKKAILKLLIKAEGFEKFLAKKYIGTKRFGLDGGESLVPALEQIIKKRRTTWC